MRQRVVIILPCLAFLIIVGFMFSFIFFTYGSYLNSEISDHYFQDGKGASDQAQTFHTSIVLSCGAVLGIFSKIIFDLLEASDDYIDHILSSKIHMIRSSLRLVFYPIILTPVVLIALYSRIENNSSDIISFLLSYQSGFFFQTVLGRKTIPPLSTD